VSIEYLELADYLATATDVTGPDVETITRVTKLDLADSALDAPAAGFGDTEFYPDFVDKAAVLIVRLAKNHPLPDGNKRAAWVSLRLFIEINDWTWATTPPIDEAEQAALAIAGGDRDEATTADGSTSIWLRGIAPDRPDQPRKRAPKRGAAQVPRLCDRTAPRDRGCPAPIRATWSPERA
jgi:death-on-curing protein